MPESTVVKALKATANITGQAANAVWGFVITSLAVQSFGPGGNTGPNNVGTCPIAYSILAALSMMSLAATAGAVLVNKCIGQSHTSNEPPVISDSAAISATANAVVTTGVIFADINKLDGAFAGTLSDASSIAASRPIALNAATCFAAGGLMGLVANADDFRAAKDPQQKIDTILGAAENLGGITIAQQFGAFAPIAHPALAVTAAALTMPGAINSVLNLLSSVVDLFSRNKQSSTPDIEQGKAVNSDTNAGTSKPWSIGSFFGSFFGSSQKPAAQNPATAERAPLLAQQP